MRKSDAAVKSLGESFQVHIGGVSVIVNIVEGLPSYIAVRDHHGFNSGFARGVAYINDIFRPDGRLVVGECNGWTAIANRQRDNILRRNVRGMHLIGFRFRDVPILAKKTAHIAASGTERKYSRAGKEMIERFFLDGIDLQRCRRSVPETIKFSALINANETETRLALSDVAMPRAKIAVHAAFGHGLPPAAFVERFSLLKYF